MDASQTCDQVLQFLKSSKLNYFLSESAFSVSIEIKKTFITNKDGSLRSPNFGHLESDHINALKNENALLRGEKEAIKNKLERIIDDKMIRAPFKPFLIRISNFHQDIHLSSTARGDLF